MHRKKHASVACNSDATAIKISYTSQLTTTVHQLEEKKAKCCTNIVKQTKKLLFHRPPSREGEVDFPLLTEMIPHGMSLTKTYAYQNTAVSGRSLRSDEEEKSISKDSTSCVCTAIWRTPNDLKFLRN